MSPVPDCLSFSRAFPGSQVCGAKVSQLDFHLLSRMRHQVDVALERIGRIEDFAHPFAIDPGRERGSLRRPPLPRSRKILPVRSPQCPFQRQRRPVWASPRLATLDSGWPIPVIYRRDVTRTARDYPSWRNRPVLVPCSLTNFNLVADVSHHQRSR